VEPEDNPTYPDVVGGVVVRVWFFLDMHTYFILQMTSFTTLIRL
jgi:hypothetical protein